MLLRKRPCRSLIRRLPQYHLPELPQLNRTTKTFNGAGRLGTGQWAKGKVVNMVVQYEAKFSEVWHPIVRYDCLHGFLHRDVMFPGGKKERHPLDIPDLKTALLYAEQDIKDRWKWYRDRYRRRLMK
ncbi:MAG TPA: hypothetical protein ENH82_01835 [bacterium]|nr:hypothetical protein [bacterium]